MKKRPLPDLLLDLDDDQRADVERQLGIGLEPVGTPQTLAGKIARTQGKASPHTGKGAKKGPSATEKRFMAWLDLLKQAGEILAWDYEPIRVVLRATRATHRTDFLVSVRWRYDADPSYPLGGAHRLVLIEIKPKDGDTGRPYVTAAASLRIRSAAERLKGLIPVFLAWPQGSGWAFDLVETCS